MSDPIALYYQIVAALRGDNDEVTKRLFDPDFTVYEDPGLPYGGVFQGSDAFIALRKKVKAYFDLKILYCCAEPDGERMVVVFNAKGCPGAPTEAVETLLAVLWTFRDALAVEARVIYYDTPKVVAALAAA